MIIRVILILLVLVVGFTVLVPAVLGFAGLDGFQFGVAAGAAGKKPFATAPFQHEPR